MIMPSLIFVESNTTGTGAQFAKTAVSMGYRPILLTDNPARYPDIKADQIDVVREDTSDLDRLRERIAGLAAEAPLAGIYSSSEYFIETAARLAAYHGLPGADMLALRKCRNKRMQRECLQEAGVEIPGFVPARSLAEVGAALRRLPLPVIVKPVYGTGSVGVRLCRNESEALKHGTDLLCNAVNERGMPIPREILVEEYLTGVEYSVETFSASVVGITEKHCTPPPVF